MNPDSFQLQVPDDPFYYFIHIEKTGGLTFNGILVSQFPEGRVFMGDMHSLLNQGEDQKFFIATGNFRYTRAHFPIFPFSFDREVVYLTMLRDPIQRTLSLYKQDVRGLSVQKSEIPSLQDWLLQDERSWNAQTRLLSGNWIGARGSRHAEDLINHPDKPLTNEKFLSTAKENLRENIAFFGITEKFQDSLVLFKTLFKNFSFDEYRSFNRAITNEETPLTLSDVSALQRNNSLDVELYAYANGLFDEILHSVEKSVSANSPPREVKELPLFEETIPSSHAVSFEYTCSVCKSHPVRSFKIGNSSMTNHCPRCGASERGECLVLLLDDMDPQWKRKKIHEFNPQLMPIFRKNRRYQVSYFHWDDIENPIRRGAVQKLGSLNIRPNSLNYFIAIDAMDFVREHPPIFDEVLRTLKPGGKFLFTLQINQSVTKTFRRAIFMPAGPEPLYMPKYRKGALGGELLVAWEIGRDVTDFLSEWISPHHYRYIFDSRFCFEEYMVMVVIVERGSEKKFENKHEKDD